MAPDRGFAIRFVSLSLAVLGVCAGCKRAPAVRLTYQVDVDAAYDGKTNPEEVMQRTRSRIDWRLDELLGSRSESVTTRGHDLLVELAALEPGALLEIERLVASPGRCEFKLVDDRGSATIFLPTSGNVAPTEEGIDTHEEAAPGGVDFKGNKASVEAFYARIACRPSKYPGESLEQCLGRLEAWTSTLEVPGDHQIGFERVTEAVPGTDPPQVQQVGWRTFYLYSRAELANDSIRDVSIGQDQQNEGNIYVQLSFSAAGADRFEKITGENVNRRFAILLDGVVASAPFIKQKIAGGSAIIRMAQAPSEKQLHDAKQLELVLFSGALPAPMRLVSEERLRPGAK
jgi:preprotein translocase subunit SecD